VFGAKDSVRVRQNSHIPTAYRNRSGERRSCENEPLETGERRIAVFRLKLCLADTDDVATAFQMLQVKAATVPLLISEQANPIVWLAASGEQQHDRPTTGQLSQNAGLKAWSTPPSACTRAWGEWASGTAGEVTYSNIIVLRLRRFQLRSRITSYRNLVGSQGYRSPWGGAADRDRGSCRAARLSSSPTAFLA
jgi:hypothetical protein